MRVFIASNEPSIATGLRTCLAAQGVECPLDRTMTVDTALRTLSDSGASIDAVFVVTEGLPGSPTDVVTRFRSLTDMRIIVSGRVRGTREVLDLLHHGADDFIDLNRDLREQVVEILQSPRMRADSRGNDLPRLLGVIAASGGSGASTLAVNLAVAAAGQSKKCGLIDFDLEKGDLAYLLNLNPRHTIAELCRSVSSMDLSMLEKTFVAHESGVCLLAASDAAAREESVHRQLGRVLDLAGQMYPWCVVDFGRQGSPTQQADVLAKCQRILIVLQSDFTGVCNARRVLDRLERSQIDASRVLLVGNRRGMPVEIPPNKARMILGRDLDHLIPDDPVTANFSVNCGAPFCLEAPKSRASRAVRTLHGSLRESLDGRTPGSASEEGRGPDSGSRNALKLVHQAASLLLFMRTAT